MILLVHILIAISSVILATIAFVNPSKKILYSTYVAITATLVSGTYLTVLRPNHLAQTCLTGLVYLSFVSTIAFLARRKLVAEFTT